MVKVEKEKKDAETTAKQTENTQKAERVKALELAVSQIEKQFGKGSIMKLSKDIKESIEVIRTGAISLDLALGVGGVPRGRVIEIFGPESSGKTTLTLSIISQVQKRGGTAAFIDAENAFDSTYAKKIGVNLDDLLISQPDSGEQALEIAETLVRSNAVDVIVIDSVAALVPRAEIEGEMGDSHMGLQARLMSQALRKLSSAINKSKTCVIFINQIREKIGIMFGNPETTPGGRALKFYASVRLDIRRKEYLKSGDIIVGSHVLAKVVKNKVAPPFRSAEFDIIYSEGISREGSVLDTAITYNIIQKQGSWFAYGDTKLGQGREATISYLKQNPKLVSELEQKIIKEHTAQTATT
jgi:recombination protein RecA